MQAIARDLHHPVQSQLRVIDAKKCHVLLLHVEYLSSAELHLGSAVAGLSRVGVGLK
jgi:hypothetical protein